MMEKTKKRKISSLYDNKEEKHFGLTLQKRKRRINHQLRLERKVSKVGDTDEKAPPSTTAPPTAGSVRTSAKKRRYSDKTDGNLYRGRYCHCYVNQGKCNFEERTGQKCRYEHKQAPMCNFGINCTNYKCMYSHPKKTEIQNQTRNPFVIMNPWMMPQNFWNTASPRMNGRRQNTIQ